MGIEPTHSAWEAEILPLNYIRTRWREIVVTAPSLHRSLILIEFFFPDPRTRPRYQNEALLLVIIDRLFDVT